MKNSIILLGCGGHAKSIIDTIEVEKKWIIKGLIGLPSQKREQLLGYSVIGSDLDLESLRQNINYAFISIGQITSSKKRIEVAKKLLKYNYTSPNIKSPFSIISKNGNYGVGNFFGHGSIINAGGMIGDFCIINTKALIEHDVKIGSFCHISTGAIINGGVEIGERCFIGSGVIIREGLKIPNGSIISAGKRVMGWPIKNE